MDTQIVKEKLLSLGARVNARQEINATAALEDAGQLVPLTANHKLMLMELVGPIEFNNGARFRADTSLSAHGWLRLLELFGLGNADGSIEGEYRRYVDDLKASLVPIGLL